MFQAQNHACNPARPVSRWSATVLLISLNAVVFVAQNAADYLNLPPALERSLALSPEGLEHGYFWQLLTFQFLHANIFHILGNMFTIYFLGLAVEEVLGRANFLKLYLVSDMLGGLAQVAVSLAWPAHFGSGGIMGASAGGFGLVAAFAALFPQRPLYLFFLPIAIRAWVALALGVLASIVGLFMSFAPGQMHIAHAAHLGGMLGGFWMLRRCLHGQAESRKQAAAQKETLGLAPVLD